MGIKNRLLDTVGMQTVFGDIEVISGYVFKGSPFSVRARVKGGKKGAFVEGIMYTVYFETTVSDPAMDLLSTIVDIGLIVVGEGGGGGGGSGYKTVKITLDQAVVNERFQLGPAEERTIDLTPSIPDNYPMGIMPGIYLKLDISVSRAPDISVTRRIDIFPNRATSAPMMVLAQKYGFKQKPLYDQTQQPAKGERFHFVSGDGSYGRVKVVDLTVTDLDDGRMEYVMAFEMYEKPGSLLKGKHETVMVHFEIVKDRLVMAGGALDLEFMEMKMEEAFSQAESKFGRNYSVKM
jgi:hypothetical protein